MVECYINRKSLLYSSYYTREKAVEPVNKIVEYLKSVEASSPIVNLSGEKISLFEVVFVKIIEILTGYRRVLYWVEVELDTRYITIPMRGRMVNTLEKIISADYIDGGSEPDAGDLIRELWKKKQVV